MGDLFEIAGQDEPGKAGEGYWHIGKMLRLPDLPLTDASGAVVALVSGRLLLLRRYIGGPPHYQSAYSHDVFTRGGQTGRFEMSFELKNLGGGTLKEFQVIDHVACEDNGRHSYWTETITSAEYEDIMRASNTLSDNGLWQSCA